MAENKVLVMKIQIEKDEEVGSEIIGDKDNTTAEEQRIFLENSESKKNLKVIKSGRRRYTGLILAVTAGLLMTLSMVLVKMLKMYHPYTISMWRYAFNIVFSLPVILYFQFVKKTSPFLTIWPTTKSNKDNWITLFWVWMSCVSASSTFILRYYSLNFLTVADSTVIAYSGPIVVVFMAHFFLNEKCGIVSIVIALWTFLGVFAISRPPFLTGQAEFSTDTLIGTGLALIGMVVGSICIILLRRAREVQFSVLMLMSGIWGTIQSAILASAAGVIKVPEETDEMLLILAMSALAFFGGLCVTLAVKFEQAGPYALIRSIDILFAFGWQFIFLTIYPDLPSLIGAVIVITGILVTTFRKWITTLPDESSTKNLFTFLLY